MNKPRLFAFVMVLVTASLASAQITAKGSVHCGTTGGTVLSCPATSALAVTTGDTVIVGAEVNTNNASVYTITSDCGLSFTPMAGTVASVLMWKATAASTTSCNITLARPSGSATDPYLNWIAQDYSGISSVGTVTPGSFNTVTSCTGSMSIVNPNDYILGFFTSSVASGTQTITATAGTLRANSGTSNNNSVAAILDTTSATGGQSLTLSVSLALTGTCNRNLVRLVGAPIPARSVRCLVPTGTMSCTSGQLTVNAGDAIVVFIYEPAAQGGISLTDSCSQPWIARRNTTLNIYTVIGATAGTCTITARHGGSTDDRFSFLAKTYSGITSIGQVQKGTGANQTAAFSSTVTLSTQDASANYVVGAIGVNNPVTLSVTTGTLQDQIAGPLSAMVIADTTNSAQNTPVSITFASSGAGYYLNDVLELRTGAATGRLAVLDDQTHNVLLTSTANANYTLPNFLLSPNWCTWVMPTGGSTYTYQLVAQSPSTLNGQSASMTIPYYQMTRVCQDSNSNYWVSPPIVPGTGVYVLPSATGIKISTSPTGLAAPGQGPGQGSGLGPRRGQSDVAEELAELRRKVARLEREIDRLKVGRK